MARHAVKVSPSKATRRQLLVAVYRNIIRMEKRMSELSQAVADLQASVDGVVQRLLPQIDALKAANVALQSAVDADDETIAAALADSASAVAAIEADVDQLNSLGTDAPTDPTDPTDPVEPPVEPEA